MAQINKAFFIHQNNQNRGIVENLKIQEVVSGLTEILLSNSADIYF